MRRFAISISIVLLAATASASADPPQGPDLTVDEDQLERAIECFDPLGTSDRDPVLLVHGTVALPEENWGWNYAKVLPELGYTTCTVRLPDRSFGDIQLSSEYVVGAIRHIAAATDGPVDILGHSQGGLQPRWAAKWWPDIPALVDDMVSIGAPHHGADLASRCAASPFGCPPAAWQMRPGSDFLTALNADDETPDGIDHTSIYSSFDELARPPTTARLDGASNVRVQDLCPQRPTGHAALAGDAVVFALVLDAFDNVGAADPTRIDPGVCSQVAFSGVDPVTTAPAILSASASSGLGPLLEPVSSEPPLAAYAR